LRPTVGEFASALDSKPENHRSGPRRKISNDNFSRQMRIDHPISPGRFETGNLCDRGGCAVASAVRSGGFAVREPLVEAPRQQTTDTKKGLMTMSQNKTYPAGSAEMVAAKTITTRVLAIGSWTAKATPETTPPIMPSEARDTMRLMLAGKIDQWFAKNDGSGAVFLMNVTDPAEAHALLEKLPLGQAGMMTFQLIPIGPLWPLGLLLGEPTK
jgi:hypothetical protein